MDYKPNQIKKIRELNRLTQKELSELLHVDRSLISKIEQGKIKMQPSLYKEFCNLFNLDENTFLYNGEAILPDTSALIKNPRIIYDLIDSFNLVIIPNIVLNELNYNKDKRKSNNAWISLSEIKKINSDKITFIQYEGLKGNNDDKIIESGRRYQEENNIKVNIISDDVDFSYKYKNTIFLDDYKKAEYSNFIGLKKLNELYLENWKGYELEADINLNTVFNGTGNTILINTIRSQNKLKYKKLAFLIKNGVDINQCGGKYCLTSLAHCIQINDYNAFIMLLNAGADYNKGSCSNIKRHLYTRNEGNTPLMIAAWNKREHFIKCLLKKKDININQQDSNGYTALIKSVLNIKDKKMLRLGEKIYKRLLDKNADTKIRDRNNHTVEYYLKEIKNDNKSLYFN